MLRRDGGCPFTGFWSVKKATGSKPSRAKPLAPAVLTRVGGMTDGEFMGFSFCLLICSNLAARSATGSV